jgi:mono/diheme cytochrome c family protein
MRWSNRTCWLPWLASITLAALTIPAATPQTRQPEGAARPAAPGTPPSQVSNSRDLLNRYCVTCHNDRLKTAGLTLDRADTDHVGSSVELWEKVAHKLRSGAMPPPGMPRPDKSTLAAFVTHLESELDREAAVHPDPGRPLEHRLNQFEYSNAIRDLLALDIDAASLLPADESDHGFDNIAAVLSISPTLLDRYLSAARKISRLAVGDPSAPPTVETFRVSRGLRQEERMSEEFPFGTRGGIVVHPYFPLDGEYVVKITLGRSFTAARIRAINTREQIDVFLDGARVTRFEIGGQCADSGNRDPKCRAYTETADEALNVRFPARAGPHALGVAFVKKSTLTEGAAPTVLPPRHTSSTYEAPRMDIDSVRLEGPYNATGPGDTPSRRQIFVCHPARAEDEEPCARKILTALARRAYRRPVTDGDVGLLIPSYRAGRAEAGFESGIQEALARLLVSPQFLFRIERDPVNSKPGNVYHISDLELASRLSFFLWSTIPDDSLLDAATQGELRDPKVLEEQVRRMLADPRAKALTANFAGQWLHLRNIKAADPDSRLFPDFDDNLREDFRRETEMFLESQLKDNRPLEELLTANYTFVNERLAKFYGIPGVYGTHFRRVTLTDPNRRGLLGQASILTVTSYANRTSPVLRGKYVLDVILGAPPPPPPPSVPPLKETGEGGQAPESVRARMEEHRSNPVCAACHKQMDPLGFALENFDAIGKYRTMDGDSPIDASGMLADGTRFSNPIEFRQALLEHKREFMRNFTEKLMTYAIGRTVGYTDMPAVRAAVRDAAGSDYRWASLILGVVSSEPFQMRRAAEMVTASR